MPISSKPTSRQLHVSLTENRRSIQRPPSHNFRIVRNPVGNELAVTPLRSPKFARFAVAGHVQAWIGKGTF